jgi:hypothetical protein
MWGMLNLSWGMEGKTLFCICIPYEEEKEKKEDLQKVEVSSNSPQTPCASGDSWFPQGDEED